MSEEILVQIGNFHDPMQEGFLTGRSETTVKHFKLSSYSLAIEVEKEKLCLLAAKLCHFYSCLYVKVFFKPG